jgi:hypothetical protein
MTAAASRQSDQALPAPRDLIWVASYPKSGNTWVRFLLCNLLFGPQSSAAALARLAPDIHEVGPQALARHSGLVKTHWRCSAGLPLLERSAVAIYVVRQPADVLVSNFYYAQRGVGGSGADDFAAYLNAFLQHRGDPRWMQLGMGGWEENVRSWLDPRKPFPVLPIRYEDLVRDPRTVCRQLLQRLGLQRSEQQIDEAVANSSFDRLREIEAADIREQRIGIFYKPYLHAAIESGRRFMRSGCVGDGINHLSPEQLVRLKQVFGDVAASLGYPL